MWKIRRHHDLCSWRGASPCCYQKEWSTGDYQHHPQKVSLLGGTTLGCIVSVGQTQVENQQTCWEVSATVSRTRASWSRANTHKSGPRGEASLAETNTHCFPIQSTEQYNKEHIADLHKERVSVGHMIPNQHRDGSTMLPSHTRIGMTKRYALAWTPDQWPVQTRRYLFLYPLHKNYNIVGWRK